MDTVIYSSIPGLKVLKIYMYFIFIQTDGLFCHFNFLSVTLDKIIIFHHVAYCSIMNV